MTSETTNNMARHSKVQKSLIKSTSQRTKATTDQVSSIVDFASEYLANVIKADTGDGVSFPYFGKFIPKGGRT